MEICKVSEIDYAKGLIKVEFPAKDNIVSNWITFPASEYEMPEVGDLVKWSLSRMPTVTLTPAVSAIKNALTRMSCPRCKARISFTKQ